MADPRREEVTFWRGTHENIPIDHVSGRLLFETDTGDMYLDISQADRVKLTDTDKISKTYTAGGAAQSIRFESGNSYLLITGVEVSGSSRTRSEWQSWLQITPSSTLANTYLTKADAATMYVSKAEANDTFLPQSAFRWKAISD